MKREQLIKTRETKGYTVKDIALKVGITPRYYNYIEQGQRDANIEILKKIAKVLGTNNINLF